MVLLMELLEYFHSIVQFWIILFALNRYMKNSFDGQNNLCEAMENLFLDSYPYLPLKNRLP